MEILESGGCQDAIQGRNVYSLKKESKKGIMD
jgi:hypothetical protein